MLAIELAGNILVTSILVQQFPLLNADEVFEPIRTMADVHKHTIIDPWVRIPLPPNIVYNQ